MKIINNINDTLKEDLIGAIHKNSRVAIAAFCFSIYALSVSSVNIFARFSNARKEKGPVRYLLKQKGDLSVKISREE